MEKLITRKNLLILNIVLLVLFSLLVLRIVLAFAQGENDPGVTFQNPTGSEQNGNNTKQPLIAAYAAITKNDLFVLKSDEIVPVKGPKTHDNIDKVWVLQGTVRYSEGLHALILDKGRPDKKLKKPHTIYDVIVGDIIESDTKPRIYKVEILEIQKNYVKYYRLDMDDKTDDERTFEMFVWNDDKPRK